MLYRINTPFKDGQLYDRDDLASKGVTIADQEAADTKRAEGIALALSTWMALHSIPVEKRAALGVDLSQAPGLDNSTIIPLPDLEIGCANTCTGPRKHEEFALKRTGAEAVATQLRHITGLNYRSRDILPKEFQDALADGVPGKAQFIVGDPGDAITGDTRFFPDDMLLINDVKGVGNTGWTAILRTETPTPQQGELRERRFERSLERDPARQDVREVAAPKADAAFIAFYTNPDLIKALQANQREMMTAERLQALSQPIPGS